jgi:hypothetical protein
MTFESIPTGPVAGFVSSTSDSQNMNFNQGSLNVPTTTPDIFSGNTQNVQYFSENTADLYENDRFVENEQIDQKHQNSRFDGQTQVLVAPRPIQQGVSYPAYSFASSTNIQAIIQSNTQNNGNNNNTQSFSFSQQRPPSVQQSQISQVAESVVTTTTAEGKKETTIGGCMLEGETETVEFDVYSPQNFALSPSNNEHEQSLEFSEPNSPNIHSQTMQTVVGKRSFLERKSQEDMFDESPGSESSSSTSSSLSSLGASEENFENKNHQLSQLQHLIQKAQPESCDASSNSGVSGHGSRGVFSHFNVNQQFSEMTLKNQRSNNLKSNHSKNNRNSLNSNTSSTNYVTQVKDGW